MTTNTPKKPAAPKVEAVTAEQEPPTETPEQIAEREQIAQAQQVADEAEAHRVAAEDAAEEQRIADELAEVERQATAQREADEAAAIKEAQDRAAAEQTAGESTEGDAFDLSPYTQLSSGTNAAYWTPAAEAAKVAIENAGGSPTFTQVLVLAVYGALSIEDPEELGEALEEVAQVVEAWQDSLSTDLLNA